VYDHGVIRAIIKPRASTTTDRVVSINDYERLRKVINRTRRFYGIRRKIRRAAVRSRLLLKLLIEDRATLVREVKRVFIKRKE